jgi:lysine biosynthesis protein LysW
VTTSTSNQARTASCPHCGREVRLSGRLMIGEVFGCGSCHAQLEVASTDPLTLETLAKVEEDEEDFVQ